MIKYLYDRCCIKGAWTKTKVGRIEGGRWGWLGSGWQSSEGKMEITVLEKKKELAKTKKKVNFAKLFLIVTNWKLKYLTIQDS